jgi:autotransporter-associated beta strand protein
LALGLLVSALSPLPAVTLYWDTNGTTTGAGATPTGTWSTTNVAANRRWNSNVNGTAATAAWTSGSDAVFSAGTDAINAYTVTLSGTVNVSSVTIEEGTPTFTSSAITFNDVTPDFTVGTGRTATVNSDIAGTNGLNKLGAGTLILGTTDKTYTGTTTISAGTMQLDFNQTFSTVALAGGTLKLNSASNAITTLNITGNSTIDFASAAATLNVTNLTISAGVTLTITNWANAADFFYATSWTGAVVDTRGSTPMNQVTFNGFTAANTQWQGYDSQVTPVPEPSAYGALLLGALTALFAWRRRA